MTDDELQQKLKQAVEIVEGAKIPADLRAVALGKIFDALRGADNPQGARPRSRTPRKRRPKGTDAPTGERVQTRATGPKALISNLVDERFFDDWKALADVQARLRVKGYKLKQPAISPALLRLTQEGTLVREERESPDGHGKQWMYQAATS